MRIGYFSPSFKRSGIKSLAQKAYPFIKLVVAESEAQAYRDAGNDVITCPDEIQGNISRVRNWILDVYLGDEHEHQFDCVIMMDDDVEFIARWEAQQKKRFNPDELQEFCENHCIMATDAGVMMWGLNCSKDKGVYVEYNPYGFLQVILGPFSAHMAGSALRYDETMPLKEDYDIYLQHLYHNKRILRVNYVFYEKRQYGKPGGCSTYRNQDTERAQFLLLQKKWGEDVVAQDKKSKRAFDFNPIIKVPLRGV